MIYKDEIIQKIHEKKAKIGVIGMGYVGLPLLLTFVESGYNSLGFDIDSQKVELLNKGKSYIKHIGDERIFNAKNHKLFEATDDFSRISEVDVIIICVPTPLNRYNEPDLSFVINTVEAITLFLQKGQLISLESTTFPGTTEEELKPRIEKTGLVVGEDIFLVFSPEREDPGNKTYNTKTIPKVVGGISTNCLQVGKILYESIIEKVVVVSSTKAAELTKLLENIYRAVNIGLVNEMKIITDKMGIDIWEVIDAASTKPFGFTPFYPGPGWGGHCIPIDPFYLTWKVKEYDVNTHFIELAGEINTKMPEWVVNKINDALNIRYRSLSQSTILVLGISYKKNIDDMRESPAVKLMEILRAKGASILYSDPYFEDFPKMREHHFNLKSVKITEALLAEMDCVLIATDHDVFDYEFIQKHSNLIVDTRGRYRHKFFNVVKA